MALSTGIGALFSIATGVLLAALGAYVWRVAPRSRQNTSLALLVGGWGVVIVTSWLVPPEDPLYLDLWIISPGPLSLVLAAAVLVLSHDLGGRDAPLVERRRLLWAAPLAFLTIPLHIALVALGPETPLNMVWGTGPAARWALAVVASGRWMAMGAIALLLILAALRYPRIARERPEDAPGVFLVTLGLGIYWTQQTGYWVTTLIVPDGPSSLLPASIARGIISGVTVLVLACLWLRNAALSPPSHSARARWAAWTFLLAMLGSMILAITLPESTPDSREVYGIVIGLVRLLALVTFAYAILRHQLLGIDVRVRWGISRSTVAAVFIAVFFVASEAAQQFFGDTIGSTYLGIAAAGALVFAIAPLQRAAERLAEKAVPVAGPRGGGRFTKEEAAYVAAIRAAARDGVVSRREERHLADVAEHLGIGPKRALELREHVETEVTP